MNKTLTNNHKTNSNKITNHLKQNQWSRDAERSPKPSFCRVVMTPWHACVVVVVVILIVVAVVVVAVVVVAGRPRK
jgi:subtilase family serine protease